MLNISEIKQGNEMTRPLNRRSFAAASAAGLALTCGPGLVLGQDPQESPHKKKSPHSKDESKDEKKKERKPVEAPFERDYDAPKFKPSWKRPQINREMSQDFVIYAHSDLEMVKKLLEREPGLLNASMDWGAGDWETALGGASHMGRKDIVEFLLSQGARNDIFCAAMMGLLDVVKALITLEPNLIDSRGPHGRFDLHFHAQVGGEDSKPVLDYLQSVKEKKLGPNPFMRKKKSAK